jgi:hypothetical protein
MKVTLLIADFARVAGTPAGDARAAPLVVPFGPLDAEDGRYELRPTINDETNADWVLAFTVRQQQG